MTVDPFTYEVLRHRLASIAREGAIALQRVSGSPLATEALDLNTSIMTPEGDVVVAGPFLLTGPMGQGMIVRGILANPPGGDPVEPGDMFLCNDPYAGAAHQNCVTLVAPIHARDHLVAWAGATLHVVDVGGPTAGQVGVGARSIHDEAPPIPPLRIMARGRVLAEIEADYLARSRTPELNALDLRAKMAALHTIARRVRALVAEHGRPTFAAVLDTTIERGVSHLRRRILELPEAAVVQSAFLDHVDDDETAFYEVRLALSRAGDRLVFDFRGSSSQAPAVINATRSGLMSGVLVGALTTLVWDAPWCPAAVERSIEVRTEPGTVVDARWPAGCSMATMGAGFAATTATAIGLGRLLAASAAHRERAMASWAGAVGSVDLFGSDAEGRPFGTVLLDSMASGTGARALGDGIDSGGFLRSISCVVANVEQYEARFPLLYLWRRHEPDTAGPGRTRGGVGVGYAVIPRGVDRIPSVTPHFSGTAQPESMGLLGGHPGATNAVTVVRSSGATASLHAGRVPVEDGALTGTRTPLPGVTQLALERDDALVVVSSGGGGWGDPIERDPAAVARDIGAGLVGAPMAAEAYGVILAADGRPDARASAERRSAIRARRARDSGVDPASERTGGRRSDAAALDGLVRVNPEGMAWTCPRCELQLPAADGSSMALDPPDLPRAVRPLSVAGPHVGPSERVARFHLVERYCPGCLRLVATERVMTDGSPTEDQVE